MVAISQGADLLANRAAGWLLGGGRLKPNVSVSQAAAEIDAIGRTLALDFPEQNRDTGLQLLPASPVPGNAGVITAFMALLMGLVALLLAVACANLTGVLLARALDRRREIAVRLAIGATRARLVRQFLTETLTLFTLGGVGGLLMVGGMTSALLALLPSLPFPVDVSLALNGRAVLFTSGLVLVSALLSGLAPALLQKIAADVGVAVRSPEMGARMAPLGLEPVGSTPEQYNAQIRQEIDKWAGIVKTANIKIE